MPPRTARACPGRRRHMGPYRAPTPRFRCGSRRCGGATVFLSLQYAVRVHERAAAHHPGVSPLFPRLAPRDRWSTRARAWRSTVHSIALAADPGHPTCAITCSIAARRSDGTVTFPPPWAAVNTNVFSMLVFFRLCFHMSAGHLDHPPPMEREALDLAGGNMMARWVRAMAKVSGRCHMHQTHVTTTALDERHYRRRGRYSRDTACGAIASALGCARTGA